MRRRDHEAVVAVYERELALARAEKQLLLDRLMSTDVIQFKGSQAIAMPAPEWDESESWAYDPTGLIRERVGSVDETE